MATKKNLSKKVSSAIAKTSYYLGLTNNPSAGHPASRKMHFHSSVEGARGGCATCFTDQLNKAPSLYFED